MTIDTASGWSDLTTYTDTQLLAHLDSLRERMTEADRHNRIVEVRTFEFRIADATRALAIINRRATEALDQQSPAGIAQADVDALLAVLRVNNLPESHALVARMWTALQVMPPALTADEVRAVVREAVIDETLRHPTTVTPLADAIAARVVDRLAGRAPAGLADIFCRLHATSERAAYGDGIPMRLVRQDAFDALRAFVASPDAVGRAQREADLREAWMTGHRETVRHSGVTDSGCGPSLMTPSESDAEEWAAEYARSKAGA